MSDVEGGAPAEVTTSPDPTKKDESASSDAPKTEDAASPQAVQTPAATEGEIPVAGKRADAANSSATPVSASDQPTSSAETKAAEPGSPVRASKSKDEWESDDEDEAAAASSETTAGGAAAPAETPSAAPDAAKVPEDAKPSDADATSPIVTRARAGDVLTKTPSGSRVEEPSKAIDAPAPADAGGKKDENEDKKDETKEDVQPRVDKKDEEKPKEKEEPVAPVALVADPAGSPEKKDEKKVPAILEIGAEVGASVGPHSLTNVSASAGVPARSASESSIDVGAAPSSPHHAHTGSLSVALTSATPVPVSPRTKKNMPVDSLMGLFAQPGASPAPTAPTSPAGPPPARPPPQLKKAPVVADVKGTIMQVWISPFSAAAGVDPKAERSSPITPKKGAAKKVIDPKLRCKICEQEVITHVFLPCGHKAACEVCATDWLRTLGTCRVCLAPAQGVAPIPGSVAAVTGLSVSTSTSAPPSPLTSPHVTPTTSATNVAGATATASASATLPPAAAGTSAGISAKPASANAATAAATPPASPLIGIASGASSVAAGLQKKIGALPKYASLRQRGLATFLLETGQGEQLAQVDHIDLSAPKGDEGRNDHKEVDLAQNFEHFSEDTYNTGVKLFNEKPKKGIEYLLEKHVITRDAASVAQWILSAPELDKIKIGEYIGEPDAFNLEVLRAFAGRLDFKNLDFDIALRQMLTHFRLPGEAQKIDRIMNSFAVRYYLQNKSNGVFKSSDAVYVLAFAVIMLNTDLHNPQVKKKMSKEEFLKNNRGINEGDNLPADFLEDLYERIKNDEIKMKSDGGKWAKANKKGWLQMGKNKDSPKKLWFVLTDTSMFWFKKMGDPELGSLPVMYFKLEKDKAKKLIFSLTQAEKGAKNPLRYTFLAPNEREFNSWLTLLQGPTQTLDV